MSPSSGRPCQCRQDECYQEPKLSGCRVAHRGEDLLVLAPQPWQEDGCKDERDENRKDDGTDGIHNDLPPDDADHKIDIDRIITIGHAGTNVTICLSVFSFRLCRPKSSVIELSRCQNYKKKGVNTLPKVTLRSDESQEQLLRRFSREVVKSRLLTDVRRKRWFVSKSELNRIAKKKASRRTRKSQKEQQQGV